MLTRDVPTITLTDAEAMMAREAIRKVYALPWCNSPELRLRAEQLIVCIDQRRQAATDRYWSAPARARRAVRQFVRNVRAWTWRHMSERVAGTALFIIAALLLFWALYQ